MSAPRAPIAAFFLVATAIYGSLHAYLWLKATRQLGLLVGKRRLGAILEPVREARPDLLVATGDMLDAVGDHLEPLAAMWRDVTPPLGKYAVTENHEYYTGIPGALAFLGGAGFRVLRDEALVIPGVVNLIGKEYRAPGGLAGSPARFRPLAELVREGDPGLFRLLLNHLPIGFEEEAAPLGVGLQAQRVATVNMSGWASTGPNSTVPGSCRGECRSECRRCRRT